MADATTYTPRLRKDYDERIAAVMTEKFGYKNRLEVPRLEKIVINMGVGEATQDKKKVETAAQEMELIIFPEISYDRIDKVRGMDIIVTTTAKTDEEARELLRLFNFPFPKVEEEKQAA
jgi:large subunit ribosomal protein L5